MSKEIITDRMRKIVKDGLKHANMKQVELAKLIGSSPAWFTKFFDGRMLTVKHERLDAIEDALSVSFFEVPASGDKLQDAASALLGFVGDALAGVTDEQAKHLAERSLELSQQGEDSVVVGRFILGEVAILLRG